jgi:2-octaprenyl-6-methoxyphenol hydroxylase
MSVDAEPNFCTCEIAIVGGGMVGMTLALALAQAGFDIVVAEEGDGRADKAETFDGRASAIAYGSRRLLAALGVWETMASEAAPIHDILVSDGALSRGASPLFLHFDRREIGREPLGHIVENRHTRRALAAAAQSHSNLRVLYGARAARLSETHTRRIVQLTDGRQISAALVVGADGRNSPVRQQAGIKTIGWRYTQTGIVATVAHARAHEGIAQEYFLPSGPFAILPLTGNRASLVWTERAALAPAVLALDERAFEAEVALRFGPYLGPIQVTGPRWSYPLSLHLARDYVRPRLALIGDAAHGIHPIAGQGLNLGLRDAAALAQVLSDAARQGEDVGALSVLSRYERWRRFDTVTLAAATDLLNRLFSNDIAPLRLARDLGLALAGAIGPARRFLMREAGGDIGLLPRLMRGEPL